MTRFYKLFVVLLLLSVTGCVTVRMPDGSERKYAFVYPTARIKITNNVAQYLTIEDIYGTICDSLSYGESYTAVLSSGPRGYSTGRVVVVVKGYDKFGEYLGSYEKDFYTSSNGVDDYSWLVGYLTKNGGAW